MSSVRLRELAKLLEAPANEGSLTVAVVVTEPKSTCRYSAVTDHCGVSATETPPPAVQPVLVSDVLLPPDAPGAGLAASLKAFVTLRSVRARPPVPKTSTFGLT